MLLIYTFLTLLFMFAPCVEDDLHRPETQYRYPAIEDIFGNGVWRAEDITYIAGNGQEFKLSDMMIGGCYLGLTLEFSGNILKEHFRSNAYAMRWATSLFFYTFDRETGYIYTTDSLQPYAQVIEYDKEKQTALLYCKYGKYVYMDMLDGHKGEDGLDKGSYARMLMKPFTSEKDLKEIAETELIYDFRK